MNRGVVAFELSTLGVGLWALAAIWAFSTPAGVNFILRRLIGDAPIAITIQNAALAPPVGLSPATWRVVVSGIAVVPDDPQRPTVHVTRLTVGSPELVRAWLKRELRFEQVDVVGLDVYAKRSNEPRAWTPRKTALNRITVDQLEVWDASVSVEEDALRAGVDVRRIAGTVTDLVYEPATRALHGAGSFTATSLQHGRAQVLDVALPSAIATGHHLEWTGGTFSFGGGNGRADGVIDGLDALPAVTMTLGLDDVEAGALVTTSTGRESPLQGRLSAALTLHAGGASTV